MNKISKVKHTYKTFYDDMEKLESFYRVTKLSYFLSDNLLNNNINSKFLNKNTQYPTYGISYSPADIDVKYSKIVAKWISLKSYSKQYNLDYNQVKNDAKLGKLGKTILKNKTTYVIWPKEKQFSDDVKDLDINEKIYSFNICTKYLSHVTLTNPSSDDFISIMNDENTTQNVFRRDAIYRLNENCFLSCFVYFENFVRNIINDLIDLDPEAMFNNRDISKEQITYSEVFNLSSEFTDINELKKSISQRIIDKQSSSKQSINSLINMIRDYFLDGDPYDTWYVLNKNRIEVNYNDLLDFKEIRNIVVHNNGVLKKNILKGLEVSIDKNNRIVFDNNLYQKAFLTIKSVSYKIYKLIENKYK